MRGVCSLTACHRVADYHCGAVAGWGVGEGAVELAADAEGGGLGRWSLLR